MKGWAGPGDRQGSMQVLIVQSQKELAELWGRHLERRGAVVHLAEDQENERKEEEEIKHFMAAVDNKSNDDKKASG